MAVQLHTKTGKKGRKKNKQRLKGRGRKEEGIYGK
jgi:hypothetical protein